MLSNNGINYNYNHKLVILVDKHGTLVYCLTKISIRAKRSISRVFSLFIVPVPFLYIARTIYLLTGYPVRTEKY